MCLVNDRNSFILAASLSKFSLHPTLLQPRQNLERLTVRDDETVENYGIQNGQTVHCTDSYLLNLTTLLVVQTQAPATSAPGVSASTAIPPTFQQTAPPAQRQQQVPTNLSSGAGAFNPFAGLTGARFAGQVPLPDMSLFGPDRIFPFLKKRKIN